MANEETENKNLNNKGTLNSVRQRCCCKCYLDFKMSSGRTLLLFPKEYLRWKKPQNNKSLSHKL